MHKFFSDTLFCVEHLNGIAAWQSHVQVTLDSLICVLINCYIRPLFCKCCLCASSLEYGAPWLHWYVCLYYLWAFQGYIVLTGVLSMAFSEVLYVVRSEISITLSLSHLSFLFCLHLIICMEKLFVLMKIFLFHLFYVGCIHSSRGLLEHQCLKCLPLNRSCQCGHAIMCTRGGLEHSTQVCLFLTCFIS
jgi:hypothetical protein